MPDGDGGEVDESLIGHCVGVCFQPMNSSVLDELLVSSSICLSHDITMYVVVSVRASIRYVIDPVLPDEGRTKGFIDNETDIYRL